jgi:hypothetical protein
MMRGETLHSNRLNLYITLSASSSHNLFLNADSIILSSHDNTTPPVKPTQHNTTQHNTAQSTPIGCTDNPHYMRTLRTVRTDAPDTVRYAGFEKKSLEKSAPPDNSVQLSSVQYSSFSTVQDSSVGLSTVQLG